MHMLPSPPESRGNQPIFNAPAGIVWLLGLLAGIHLVRSFLPIDSDNWLVGATAFIPARYSDPEAVALPGGYAANYTSWITHMLIHGSVLHLMFNAAWLLAFGGAVANRVGSARCLAFAALCGLAGAALFLFVNWGKFAPMVGASGAVMGLMGASMRFLYPALDRGRGSLRNIHRNLRDVPLMSLRQSLTDIRVLLTTGMLIVLNFTGVLGLGPGSSEGSIAWEAHAGGYLAGFLLFGFFDTAPHKTEAEELGEFEDYRENAPDKPTFH
jgi:membrane associated rhomboid family serine protease